MNPLILVVDDERAILELVRYNLVRAGFRVLTTASGKEALVTMQTTRIDLVVLDLMLPDVTGFEVCRQFRRHSRAPVMVLTARCDDLDRVRALDDGADDYMTKPFSTREFTARVRAHLRRWSWFEADDSRDDEAIIVGQLHLDLADRRVHFRGKEIHVTPMEFHVLRVLGRTPGRVIPRERLLKLATGEDSRGSARTVDVHIRALRLKLEDDPGNPRFLETVRGAGYCIGRSRSDRQEDGSA